MDRRHDASERAGRFANPTALSFGLGTEQTLKAVTVVESLNAGVPVVGIRMGGARTSCGTA